MHYSKQIKFILTLILPEPKVIRLGHQYRARPVCISVQSDQILYCWLTNQVLIKIIMDSSKMEGGLFHLRNSAG